MHKVTHAAVNVVLGDFPGRARLGGVVSTDTITYGQLTPLAW